MNHLFPQQQTVLEHPQKQRHPTVWPGNILTYNAVIAACHAGAQWQRALEFLADLQRLHLESNSKLGFRLFGVRFGFQQTRCGWDGLGVWLGGWFEGRFI